MSIKINITDASAIDCEAFVTRMPGAKISHLPAWADAVAQATGLKSFYLAARDGDEIRGVLPLMHVRSRLFGNRMVSQAFSNYGGPLADSSQIQDALFDHAVELATELNCQSIEFRNVKPLPYNLQTRTEKTCMHLPLNTDPDQMWKSFKSKVRNHVRKAEKSGITVSSAGQELINQFYRVYTVRMRELGTPCYPRKLMHSIMQTFPDNCRIFIARLNKLTVAAGFTICFNGFVEIPWAAALVRYNSLCPNSLLYWCIIKHYCISGANCFDFGRCTVNGPTYSFKREWASEPVGLHYQYWVGPHTQFRPLEPDNPRYRKKVQLWKRLPLWVTRLLGPYISRSLP